MTGKLATIRVLDDLQRQPRGRELTCHECGHVWTLPALWNADVCELCGAMVEVGSDPMPLIRVMREVLAWAGVDWRNLGCTLGNPHEWPPSVAQQLQQQGAPQFLWLDDTFQWDCLKCAQCCSQAQIFDAEEAAQLTPEVAKRLGVTGRKLLMCQGTKACQFWHPKKFCTVHAKRPLFCRTFPLGCMKLQRGDTLQDHIAIMGPGCNGLGQGSTWTVREYLCASGVLHKFFEC